MAAAILTLVLSFMLGGTLWLVAGSRIPLSEDVERNQVLNLIALVGIFLLPVFLLLFYVINVG